MVKRGDIYKAGCLYPIVYGSIYYSFIKQLLFMGFGKKQCVRKMSKNHYLPCQTTTYTNMVCMIMTVKQMAETFFYCIKYRASYDKIYSLFDDASLHCDYDVIMTETPQGCEKLSQPHPRTPFLREHFTTLYTISVSLQKTVCKFKKRGSIKLSIS